MNNETKLYQINDQVLKNILIFLARASLKGEEVQAFNEVVYALSHPVQNEKEENK